jgi:hypothetical protein
MLLNGRLACLFLVLLLCADGFLFAQDQRPRFSSSPAIYDKTIISEIHFYGDTQLATQEQSRIEELYKAPNVNATTR